MLEEQLLVQFEKQRLVVNESSDKVQYLTQKVNTLDRHLPIMIQEILEVHFDKKVNDLLSKLVTREEFKESVSLKLDYSIFRDYEKMVSSDRTQELKNFQFEEKLFNLERAL